MTIGVKYCGGCNPRYERGGIVRRLRKEYSGYPGVEIEPMQPQKTYDLVLFISGCRAECVKLQADKRKKNAIAVHQESDYDKIRNFMERCDEG